MPVGISPPNPQELIERPTFGILLRELASRFDHVIVDTPAALDPHLLPEMTRDADKVIVPVLPSDIDIHACSKCIRDLLLADFSIAKHTDFLKKAILLREASPRH